MPNWTRERPTWEGSCWFVRTGCTEAEVGWLDNGYTYPTADSVMYSGSFGLAPAEVSAWYGPLTPPPLEDEDV